MNRVPYIITARYCVFSSIIQIERSRGFDRARSSIGVPFCNAGFRGLVTLSNFPTTVVDPCRAVSVLRA